MNPRELAKWYAGGRAAIGAVLMLFPGRAMRDLIASGDRRTKAVGRMIGIRDLLLGAGGVAALQKGLDDTAVRPWMAYGAVADAVDAAGFALAYKQLPPWKRAGFLLLALTGAATGAYLVAQLDD